MKNRRGLALVGAAAVAMVGAGALVAAMRDSKANAYAPSLAVVRDLIANRHLDQAEAVLAGISGPDADVLRAKVLIERSRWNEARDVLADVLKGNPEHYEALRAMAEGCRDAGEVDAAISWYQRMAQADQKAGVKDARPWREIARLAHRKGDTTMALFAAQQVMALSPSDSEMAQLVGQCVAADAKGSNKPTAFAPGSFAPTGVPKPQDYMPRLPKAPIPEPVNHGN